MRTILLSCILSILLSCQGQSQKSVLLKPGYDFSQIKTVALESVRDYPGAPGSGETITRLLKPALQKLGLSIVPSQGSSPPDGIILCSITEFNEQRTNYVPLSVKESDDSISRIAPIYKENDTGATAGKGSLVSDQQLKKSVTRAMAIQYRDASVGITLQLIEAQNNTTRWNSDFSYSGLSGAKTLNRCVDGVLAPLSKLLKK